MWILRYSPFSFTLIWLNKKKDMYNGIGLQTPRGSGTNGYIQSNKFFVWSKTEKGSGKGYDEGQGVIKKPNEEILEHDRKRQIELKLIVLEEKLAEQGYTDNEIAEKLAEAQNNLEAATKGAELDPDLVPRNNVRCTDTPDSCSKMETLKAALGISLEIGTTTKGKKNQESEESKESSELTDSSSSGTGKKHRKKTLKRQYEKHQSAASESDSDIDHSRNQRSFRGGGKSRRHDDDDLPKSDER